MSFEFYPTGRKLVTVLLEYVKLEGRVFECCSGDGHISKYLNNPIVNDLYKGGKDAAKFPVWEEVKPDWTVTNPPFSQALNIVANAVHYSALGAAFLLRLSFLEPTRDRRSFLERKPPNKLIVLSRFSFTGDGKTDSVTCAWMIWDKTNESWIKVVAL